MATKQEIVDGIRAGMARVQQTFGTLTDGQLATKVHESDGGWTAKEILCHLAGRADVFTLLSQFAETGSFPANFDGAHWNQERVDARIGKSRDELLAEFRSVHEAWIERVGGLSDEVLAKTVQRATGPTTFGDMLRGSGGTHSINHTIEVEKALNLPSD
jgi:hypothetical protein